MTEFEKDILSLLRKIDEKLDKLLGTSSLEAESAKTATPPEDEYVKPSAVVEKIEEEERAKEKPPVPEGRRVCPACGGTLFNTEEDKSQVLFQQGGMKIYAKKYICRQCGTEA